MNTVTMNTLFSSATPHWNTPTDLVEEIVQFFGQIDLDPSPDAQRSIPAKQHAENGLDILWHGRVYCNPPYGREVGKWTDKARHDWEYGPADEIILLLPARPDTSWFQPLFAYTICFIQGRLHFSGSTNSAPFPSALVYMGWRNRRFRTMFADRGRIISEI